MTGDPAARPTLAQVRAHHLRRLNLAIRRPGMWGRELTIRLFLDDVAFVDGLEETWRREQEQLRERGAFNALGVHGVVSHILPGYHDDGAAVASVYADIAWRHGWLTVDRALPDTDHRRLRDGLAAWCATGRDLDAVLADFRQPSVWCGGTGRAWPKTLIYTSVDSTVGPVSLHFAPAPGGDPAHGGDPPPLLVAARHGNGPFRDTFTFTPAGGAHPAGSPASSPGPA